MDKLQGEAAQRAEAWLAGKTTGASSKALCAFFMGDASVHISYPRDAGDFGRCLGLIEAVPEIEPRLAEFGPAIGGYEGEIWAALAAAWPELKEAHAAGEMKKASERIQEIIKPIEKASGQVGQIGIATVSVPRTIGEPPREFVSTGSEADLFDEAARLIITSQKASTSYIQRHLQIGYNRAARIIECLEEAGLVSAANETGQRTVLVNDLAHYEKSTELVKKVQEIAAALRMNPETVLKKATAAAGIRPAGPGHNSGDDETSEVGGVSGRRLKAFLDRVERMEEEKKALAEDIKEIYAEAKGTGFDVKTMRKLVRLRKMDPEKRREEEELLDLYKAASGLS